MHHILSNTTLKSGEPIDVRLVLAPDQQHERSILHLLGHKSGNFQFHLRQAFAGATGTLETRFYLGLLDGDPICNIMTVEADGVGILGHVFTCPEHRRKGVCNAVMERQMEDFRRRGGRALYLGTGFQTPPYWIYHAFGFRSITGDSGFMRYLSSPDFDETHFAPGPTDVRDVQWSDWPKLCVLLGMIGAPCLRNLALGRFGASNFESGFLTFYEPYLTSTDQQARVLCAEGGSVVGFATLLPDRRWQGETYLLDMFVHPRFASETEGLVFSLSFPTAKVQAFVEAGRVHVTDALTRNGFEREAVFTNQVRSGGTHLDVEVWIRR